MMNGPYYRNHSRSIPVQQPKVVSIPVHFVSSDQPQTTISTLKHSSALKIQKFFRGHTVRKSVKKIVSIKNQVNEIEERLKNDAVFVKLLRNDAKERLRVNETLMSLLFKLDSVRGVEIGVRDLRKSVAKKAVALQEQVDYIAESHHDDVSNDEKTELCDGDDVSNSIGNEVNGEDVKEVVVDDDVTKKDQNPELVEDQVIDDVSNKNRDKEELVVDEVMNEDSIKECGDDVSSNVRNRESVEIEQDVKEGVEKKCDDDDDVSKSCCDHVTVVNEDRVIEDGRMNDCGGGDDEVGKRCCEKGMVEKLMCDNAKMMKLMIQISERNEMQTRMINSLSKRVEQLEKAFMSDKSRRRKKSYTKREKDGFCI